MGRAAPDGEQGYAGLHGETVGLCLQPRHGRDANHPSAKTALPAVGDCRSAQHLAVVIGHEAPPPAEKTVRHGGFSQLV